MTANQLGPLSAATDLVSVTIGGNDAGFADVMTTCVLQSEATCINRVNQAKAYVDSTLPGKLDSVYTAIRNKAPAARVVVLGYPRFYKLGGNCVACLSESERSAINGASDYLNAAVAKRAADHGYTFASVVPPFTGHEICSGSAWLHSVNWLNIGESYHPTAASTSRAATCRPSTGRCSRSVPRTRGAGTGRSGARHRARTGTGARFPVPYEVVRQRPCDQQGPDQPGREDRAPAGP